MKDDLTPHQKIMRAFRRGTGVRLTEDEVRRLGQDDAIMLEAESAACASCFGSGCAYDCIHDPREIPTRLRS